MCSVTAPSNVEGTAGIGLKRKVHWVNYSCDPCKPCVLDVRQPPSLVAQRSTKPICQLRETHSSKLTVDIKLDGRPQKTNDIPATGDVDSGEFGSSSTRKGEEAQRSALGEGEGSSMRPGEVSTEVNRMGKIRGMEILLDMARHTM